MRRMRAIDGLDWLRSRAAPEAEFATAWTAFKEYVQLPCDEPEEQYGKRVRAITREDDGDLLLFEAAARGSTSCGSSHSAMTTASTSGWPRSV